MRETIRMLQLALAAAFLAVLTAPSASAQDVVPPPETRPSPLELTRLSLDDGTYVMIHYGSPRKRGREIFGQLVPHGNVWRLGANEATEITTTQDIRFGDAVLEAGTYSLFAIPEKESWTIIVNENLGQWGAFSYSENADVARIRVPVERTEKIHEAFTMQLEKGDGEQEGHLVITWNRTRITIPIGTTTS